MNLQSRQTLETRLVYGDGGMPRRILFADDDQVSIDDTCSILRVMGFEVHIAHTVHAALELASHIAFDFVVCGFGKSPGANLDLARRLRSGNGQTSAAKLLQLIDWHTASALTADEAQLFDGVHHGHASRQDLRVALTKMLETDRVRQPLQPTAPVAPLPNAFPAAAALPPVVSFAIPAADASAKTWRRFAIGLPEEFTDMVVKLAAMQAHCFIMEMSKAAATKNHMSLFRTHRKLQNLADAFEMRDIKKLLDQHQGDAIGRQIEALGKGLENWQAGRIRVKTAA